MNANRSSEPRFNIVLEGREATRNATRSRRQPGAQQFRRRCGALQKFHRQSPGRTLRRSGPDRGLVERGRKQGSFRRDACPRQRKNSSRARMRRAGHFGSLSACAITFGERAVAPQSPLETARRCQIDEKLLRAAPTPPSLGSAPAAPLPRAADWPDTDGLASTNANARDRAGRNHAPSGAHETLNQRVQGSSPCAPTIKSKNSNGGGEVCAQHVQLSAGVSENAPIVPVLGAT